MIEEVVPVRFCPHCPWMEASGLSHTKTCRCRHHHADHNSAGGCRVAECKCDRYDQTIPGARGRMEVVIDDGVVDISTTTKLIDLCEQATKAKIAKPAAKVKSKTVIDNMPMLDLSALKEQATTKPEDSLAEVQARVDRLREKAKSKVALD